MFRLFKTSPKVRLIKRAGGTPSLASLPANERAAVLWFKPIEYLFWGHLVFMPVAYILILFWPPYHHAFMLTDWIADMLPHRIFGILTVTQEQLDAAGATLPRPAYIHFIIEQIMPASIYLLWLLANCHRYWRLYPHYETYLHRKFENLDEQRASISWPAKLAIILTLPALLACVIWFISSPDALLMLIESGNKPGLFSLYATGTAWGGVGSIFAFFSFIYIVNCRHIFSTLRGDWKHPKN